MEGVQTMKLVNTGIYLDRIRDLDGPDVTCCRKYFKDMKQVYENPAGMDEETLMYTVYNDGRAVSEENGSLRFGLTVMEPVLVNGECNMTRGHFHADPHCDEYYVGIRGEGILLYMDRDGKTWGEKVHPGSVHYINGQYAHRLVNTGVEKFSAGCVWPAKAGHDYKAVEQREFAVRIYLENNKVIMKERD